AFDAARKYPLVLDVRDSPRRMCGVEFDLRTQVLAARGFVVLCANGRGTPGFGEEFANLLATSNPGDDFDDPIRAAAYLATQTYIDAARIDIMVGMLAAFAIGQTERFRSAIAVDPEVVLLDRPKLSAIVFAENFKTATLVVDTTFGPGARQLYDALQQRKVESALMSIPDAGAPGRRVLFLETILGWLERK